MHYNIFADKITPQVSQYHVATPPEGMQEVNPRLLSALTTHQSNSSIGFYWGTMNSIFDSVELKMIEELAKRGSITNKRYSDKKKYLKDLIRRLYLNLWMKNTCHQKSGMNQNPEKDFSKECLMHIRKIKERRRSRNWRMIQDYGRVLPKLFVKIQL